MILPQDFREFISLLNQNNIEYLVIGGYAVSYYGYPRYTGDMDIWINKTDENALKMVAVIKSFGFDTSALSINNFNRKHLITRLGNPPLRIDVLTTIDGVAFEDSFKGRLIAEIEGLKINFISYSGLLKNKKASGRSKDRNDLENLPPS